VKDTPLLTLDAPQQTTVRDLDSEPLGCPLVSEDLICPMTGNGSCPTDPARQAKCPSC
jgi:hypothetical protein